MVCELRLGRVRDLRRARRRRTGRVRLPRLWGAVCSRGAREPDRSTGSLVPRARAGRTVVGRHRLHLKHDEPLPVGGAHRTLARRQDAGRDDPGADAVRPCTRVVGHEAPPGLAPAQPGGKPGDPRPARACRAVLETAVAARCRPATARTPGNTPARRRTPGSRSRSLRPVSYRGCAAPEGGATRRCSLVGGGPRGFFVFVHRIDTGGP